MKLFYQTHSPYARKVLVMAHETGIAGQLEVIHQETSPTLRNDAVFAANPLGKVPVLLLENGMSLFDSSVICEYLDRLHSGRPMLAAGGTARLLSLRLQALAQGVADAGILLRWETTRRPLEFRWPAQAQGQVDKLLAAYDFVEHQVDLDEPVDIGQIALATALSWTAFRELPSFVPGRPRLTRWYEQFVQRPSMQATDYSGATHD
jgi:glutathione S-transferase